MSNRVMTYSAGLRKLAQRALALCITLLVLAPYVQAARPMSVEDGGVDDTGTGHVDMWFARSSGKVYSRNITFAYSPVDAIELNLSHARNYVTSRDDTQSALVKWNALKAEDETWRITLTTAINESHSGTRSKALNVIASSYQKPANLHANLGTSHANNGLNSTTWGLAVEHAFSKLVAHAEFFGQERIKPTLQFGARYNPTPWLQIDGTIGKTNRDRLYSLGSKISF